MFTKVMKEELIAGLLKIFGNNISMIILYGSVARNEYTDESDIDIAIILKNEIDNKTKEQFINWSADMPLGADAPIHHPEHQRAAGCHHPHGDPRCLHRQLRQSDPVPAGREDFYGIE